MQIVVVFIYNNSQSEVIILTSECRNVWAAEALTAQLAQ